MPEALQVERRRNLQDCESMNLCRLMNLELWSAAAVVIRI